MTLRDPPAVVEILHEAAVVLKELDCLSQDPPVVVEILQEAAGVLVELDLQELPEWKRKVPTEVLAPSPLPAPKPSALGLEYRSATASSKDLALDNVC